jgi:hypothetical protein
LYSIHIAEEQESPRAGFNWITTEVQNYSTKKTQLIHILKYIAKFQHNLKHWEAPGKMADMIAGLLQNE